MKKEFVKGDLLPCFKYILENISDGNVAALASFTLSYIQYLQQAGITDRGQIEKSLRKLLLVAQRSVVERKKPLDFFNIKGKQYSIDSDEQYEEYLNALLKACKDAPVSFSALYKRIDERLSMCHLCPMNSQYSLMYKEKELLLARYAFENVGNFNTVISCIGDIECLFRSYTDIYTVLNNLTKAYSAPLYLLLFKAIYPATVQYYNPIFGTQEYRAIKKNFIKYLAAYGLNNKSKNFEQDFDVTIYEHLVMSMNSVTLIDKETALIYKQELMERVAYIPEFEVDTVPSVTILPAKSVEKKANKKDNIRRVKGSKKVMDVYDVSTPLTDAFDVIAGIKEVSVAADELPLLEERIVDTGEVIEVSLEKEDIVSSEGEVLVKHLVEEDGILQYEEDYGDIDTLDDDDYFEEDAIEQPDVLDNDISAQIMPSEELEISSSSTMTTLIADKNNEQSVVVSEDSHDIVVQPDASENNPDVTDKKSLMPEFKLSSLLEPIQLDMASLDGMEEILYDNQYDRLISHITNFGYLIMEPACIKTSNSSVDIVFIGFEKELYYMKLSSPYMQRLLDFHKYYAYSVRLICLYSLFEKYGLIYLRKDIFVPLFEELELSSQTYIFTMPVTEYMQFLQKRVPSYRYTDNEDSEKFPEIFKRNILLYSAYGYSLRHNRFIYHSLDNVLSYDDETGVIQFKDYTYQSGTKGMPGTIYDFSFQHLSSTGDVGYLLTEDIIVKMCKGAFFQKFHLQLLYLSPNRIRLYADEYCKDYICNYVLMQFFKIGTRYGLKPLNVTVEKSVIDPVIGLIVNK